MNEEKSPCCKCNRMTKSIRISRANYKCEKCESDKSLSDVFYSETKHELNKINDNNGNE